MSHSMKTDGQGSTFSKDFSFFKFAGWGKICTRFKVSIPGIEDFRASPLFGLRFFGLTCDQFTTTIEHKPYHFKHFLRHTNMATSFDRLFGGGGTKSNTITGISTTQQASFRSFGKAAEPNQGQRRVALSKSTSQLDAQLRRQQKPLPASTTRRASGAKRNVTHGVGKGARTTYSVEIQNRGPLDSRDNRPKVSRRIPGPTPTQYTDYLPPKHQPSLNQSRNGGLPARNTNSNRNSNSNTTRRSSHTDQISFSQSSSTSSFDNTSGNHREIRNGRWRPPTMTVSINNDHHHHQQHTNSNNRPSSAGRRARPTVSRRTQHPKPEEFSDYVNVRSTSKPLMERNPVVGDHTRHRPGQNAQVLRVGLRPGDPSRVQNMRTGHTRNSRPELDGGLQTTTTTRLQTTSKDMYYDEGKRPSLNDRFRDIESRQRFQGTAGCPWCCCLQALLATGIDTVFLFFFIAPRYIDPKTTATGDDTQQ